MMADKRGQALIEAVAFFMSLTLMVVCFLGFTKWFMTRQKLLIAVHQGAMLYSSGRMTDSEVRGRMARFLTSGSPALAAGRIQIGIGHRLGFQDISKQLDIVKVRYTSQSSWYSFTQLNPVMEEKCVIKHAATYGPGLQPFYGPPLSWLGGPIVSD
jgi:hypothetical protein